MSNTDECKNYVLKVKDWSIQLLVWSGIWSAVIPAALPACLRNPVVAESLQSCFPIFSLLFFSRKNLPVWKTLKMAVSTVMKLSFTPKKTKRPRLHQSLVGLRVSCCDVFSIYGVLCCTCDWHGWLDRQGLAGQPSLLCYQLWSRCSQLCPCQLCALMVKSKEVSWTGFVNWH